ncbi:MAG: diguanylate cyclase [Candidatus Sericytochromatia bacterium]
MPHAKLRAPNLTDLSAVFFWLVILLGGAAAAFVVVSESGFGGVFEALTAGGSPDALAEAWAMTRGTILGNPTFYLLLGLGWVAELVHIPLPKGGRMTAGFLIAFAALLMLGLPAALMVAAFVSIVTIPMHRERPWFFALFNIGQYALAYIAAHAALTYRHVYIPGFPSWDDYPNVALATVAFLVVNFLVVDSYLALQKRISPFRILWEDDRVEIVVTLALSPMALLMASMYAYAGQEWWGLGLVLIPLLATAWFVHMFIKVKKTSQELAEKNAQLTILQQVAMRISSQIDLEQTLTLISQEIRRVVSYHDCMIFLLDAQSGMLVRQHTGDASMPRQTLQLPAEHGVFGDVAREKRAMLVNDLAEGALDVGVLSGYRSLLAVPIQTESQVLGVVALLHQTERAFDGSDEQLLDILAAQAAVAIKNAQLHRATQQLAVTDGLTKVYNRRYFEEQLTAELQRGARHGHCTSLILLDVDHFKKFNDTHGHLLGDQVLQGVARVLQKSTRETDLVARYGGEEFAVVLPETPPEAALVVAERIRRNIKGHPFWGKGQTPLTVTASVGVASDPSSTLEPKPLIDIADKGLYQCKEQGRDRVYLTVHSPDGEAQVTQSRQEEAPEPTLRRPSRAVTKLSADDWGRYMRGNLEGVYAQWWEDARVESVLQDGRVFWFATAEQFLDLLLRHLDSTEEERNAWMEQFQTTRAYRPIQAELARLIQLGVTMTQLEYAILAFYKKVQSMVQGAPFPLEERMTVGAVQERLFHVMQLMITQIWHDFYQATSEHLTLIAELETRLSADYRPQAVLEEIASLTAKAMSADVCIVLTPDEAGKTLVMRAAVGISEMDETWVLPMDQGIAAACFQSQEVQLVPSFEADDRTYRPYLDRVQAKRPVKSALILPLVYQGRTLGVLHCMSEQLEHFSPLDVRLGKGIGSRLATALERQRSEADRQARYLEAITALAEALETRDQAKGRSEMLITYATALAESLSLPGHQVEALQQAGRLHDIGELGIPDAVLAKPSALDSHEQELVRNHPATGARILGYIEALRDIVPIVRHHHERMDGSGYPDGLKGEQIPLLARVLAVADAYDAMTSHRPYRQAMTPEQAFHELRRSRAYDTSLIDRLEGLVKSGAIQ